MLVFCLAFKIFLNETVLHFVIEKAFVRNFRLLRLNRFLALFVQNSIVLADFEGHALAVYLLWNDSCTNSFHRDLR